MDKKTLFAFLIIAVIILLTPAYYNILYPPVEPGDIDSLSVTTQEDIDVQTSYKIDSEKVVTQIVDQQIKEETFSIETNLYSAVISSVNGGAIQTFFFKK